MDDLIFDAVSVYTQILQLFAPDRVGTFEFQLTGYIFACLFLTIVIWTFCHILSSFAKTVMNWFNRGC